ncbi:MAG: alpha/beta fold hydrolase [Eubacteriales bacterium]|nr:alpha/beta fold hydrolase [Eubacteriales bacterium]
MYEEFVLKKIGKGIINGYSWPVDNPDRVVCIIHGIGEYGGRFNRVAVRFKERNFAVLSMDLRGHGKSINVKGHCAPRKEILEDVSDLLIYAQKKYPGKEIVLYGHSMGGNIALDYRSRGDFNDIPSAYLISAPWIRLVRSVSAPLYAFAKTASRLMPAMTIRSGVDETVLGHPDAVKPYSTNPMVHDKISLQCTIDGLDIGRKLEEGTLGDNGRAHHTPTMLMHGTEDRVCDIAGTEKVFEVLNTRGDKVDFIRWPGLFHEIHNGNTASKGDEVIDRMIEFIHSYI